MLRTYTEEHTNWDARLSALQFAINSAVSESTGVAPCDVMLGRKLQFPWKLDGPDSVWAPPSDQDLKVFAEALQNKLAGIYQFVSANLEKASEKQKRNYDKQRKQKICSGRHSLEGKTCVVGCSKAIFGKIGAVKRGSF